MLQVSLLFCFEKTRSIERQASRQRVSLRFQMSCWFQEATLRRWVDAGQIASTPRKALGKPWENGGLMGFDGIYR